jgi:hypothetical protein
MVERFYFSNVRFWMFTFGIILLLRLRLSEGRVLPIPSKVVEEKEEWRRRIAHQRQHYYTSWARIMRHFCQ